PVLFNNSISGKNISLLLKKEHLLKALNVVHGQIFGISKKINIALFGHGLVGGTLINQILESAPSIENKKEVKLNIFAIANSKKVLLDKDGIGQDWKERLEKEGQAYQVGDVIDFA